MLRAMARRESVFTSQRLMIGSLIFGLFVLFDILLFGWLFFQSLSQREIEKVLLETREEVQPLAAELERQAQEHGGDLFVVVTVAQETRTYLENVLTQRDTVRHVEIRDKDGVVVYGSREATNANEVPSQSLPPMEAPTIDTGEGRDGLPLPAEIQAQNLRPVEVPIGDLGTLIVGLSDEEVQERIGVLRQDIIRQASLIGTLTLLLLVAAMVAVWKLFHRARGLEEQAIEAERLAYVGTLASGLAHEIRNPLNSLNLNMQMLEEEARETSISSSQVRLLSLTRSELKRLEHLATDFLSYAKPRPLELEVTSAVGLLERVRGVLEGDFRKREVTSEVIDRSEGAWVKVDRSQMGQLLLNLVQNALAASEESSETPRVTLTARRQTDEVWLEVTDNGPGIPPEEKEKIFEIFFSTRKGGTGLGLAIVSRIAQAHGATLDVEDAVGGGTTVRLRLPAED